MYAEGELSSEMESALVQAIANGNLISVQTLTSPFSADPAKANLSYAESYSLVDYLISQQGGKAKMSKLLDAFRQGSGYVESIDQVYGLSIGKLDAQWREYATAKYLPTA